MQASKEGRGFFGFEDEERKVAEDRRVRRTGNFLIFLIIVIQQYKIISGSSVETGSLSKVKMMHLSAS